MASSRALTLEFSQFSFLVPFMLLYGYMDETINKLNERQKQAVLHTDGPLLIIAGAGTGKTTVITAKIGQLIINQGVKPESILALTFTDKAAGEMEERVDRLLPLGYADLWINTFHSFAERILRLEALNIGLPTDFKLLSDTEQWLLVRQNLDRFQLDYFRPLGNPTKYIHAILKLISRAKDECVTPEDYAAYAAKLEKMQTDPNNAEEIEEVAKQKEIAGIYQTYQQLLLDNAAFDFGDLINYCLRLFKTRPSILKKYRQQFQYILVDEFQDVNHAQNELVKILAGEKRNLTVVGDDDQSIYAFRGSSVSNIMQFKDDYPEAAEIFLIDNYRSSQNILDTAYRFIQRNNPDRLEVKLAGDNNLNKKLVSHLPRPAEIAHLHGKTLYDEVELAVNKIIALYNSDQEAEWSDFAVLVRSNAAAEEFDRALELAKIPHLFMSSRGLYHKPIILNLLAWFRSLIDYHEGAAIYRIVNFPIWQLNEKEIVNLNYWAARKGWSLYEVMRRALKGDDAVGKFTPKALATFQAIMDLLVKQSALVSENKKPTEIMTRFLRESGYLKLLTHNDSPSGQEQLGYLNKFYKKVAEFEAKTPAPTLRAFMEIMEMELEAGEAGALPSNRDEAGPDVVKIMTIHGSKGLEFKYVFICNLVDKKFPSINRSDLIELPAELAKEILPAGDAHLQEERRLFYVGLTRAKEGLYLTSAEDYGGAREKKLSRFLMELNEDGFVLAENCQAFPKPLLRVDQEKKLREAKQQSAASQAYLPKQFSFTQLRAYDSCPYQYRFAHILKIPLTGKPVFSFGKTMHAAMQRLHLLAQSRRPSAQTDIFSGAFGGKYQPIAWDEAQAIYEDVFIDDWFSDEASKQEYWQKGLKSLKYFFDHWDQNAPLPLYLEYGFTFKLAPDCSLRGAIDRIDQADGGIRLVDYKTGKPKAKLAAEDKEQLLLYQLAAEEVLKAKVTSLMFYYFDDNSEVEFLGKPAELEKFRNKMIGLAGQIKAGNFDARPNEEKCKRCDYRDICDFAA